MWSESGRKSRPSFSCDFVASRAPSKARSGHQALTTSRIPGGHPPRVQGCRQRQLFRPCQTATVPLHMDHGFRVSFLELSTSQKQRCSHPTEQIPHSNTAFAPSLNGNPSMSEGSNVARRIKLSRPRERVEPLQKAFARGAPLCNAGALRGFADALRHVTTLERTHARGLRLPRTSIGV